MRKPTTAYLLLAMIALSPVEATPADWVDDWLTQKTGQGAGHLQGQKRGYLSGGSFSARTQNGTSESLFSASPPSMKAGCGGIDIFGGGVSFVGTDYLVNQMEQLVADAPMVFFDIAFNTLCEPCAKAMKSAKVITDGLNSIQLDSCKASKVMVAKAYTGMGGENAQLRAEADADFSLGSGAKTLYNDVKKEWTSSPTRTVEQEAEKVASCPTPTRNLFFSPGQTILEKLGAKHNYDATYLGLTRGLVGDLSFTAPNNIPTTVYIPPCSENTPDSAEGLFKGKAKVRPSSGGACEDLSASGDMTSWAYKKLSGLSKKMKAKTPLTDSDRSFLDSLPLPTLRALQLSLNVDNSASILMPLAEITARAYAHNLMENLYGSLIAMRETARAVEMNQTPASPSCQADLILPVTIGLDRMEAQAREGFVNIRASYKASLAEYDSLTGVNKRLEEVEAKSQKNFGEIVGGRR
jgi:conjugative transfer pilus assembly protein TraH